MKTRVFWSMKLCSRKMWFIKKKQMAWIWNQAATCSCEWNSS